jgi:hypothetical protein
MSATRLHGALAPLVVLAATAIASAGFLVETSRSVIPGGWDGVPQYAIAALYANKLFPSLSGWLPEYFAGMPFPDFYPPLFYLLVGGLVRLGLSAAVAFHLVVSASVVVLPMLVAVVAQRLSASLLGGLAAGAVAIAFVIGGHSPATLGGTLQASFNLGLSTHALGLDALLASLYFLAGVPRSRRDRAWAGVCLGLVPLCNVHVAWDAALLVAAVIGVRLGLAPGRRLRVLVQHAPTLLVAALVPMCWLLPMLARLAMVPTKALEPVAVDAVLRAFLPHLVYLSAAAWLAMRRREPMLLALVGAVTAILAFSLLPLHRIASGFAIQPWRVLAAFEPLAAIAIGAMVARLADVFPSAAARVVAVAVVGLAFASRAAPFARPVELVDAARWSAYAPALDALDRAPPGRVLVEMGQGSGDGFALQGLVGSSGHASLTTVFREASLSSLFAVPLRNALSTAPEVFGIDSKLDPIAMRGSGRLDDGAIARLAAFAVGSIIAGSPETQARLDGDARFVPLGPPGPWRTYGIALPAPPWAEIPARGPLITFASLSVKARPDGGHDFMRLGEEAFARAWLDAPMVHAEVELEDAPLDRFPLALVVDARSRDTTRALEHLRHYLDGGGALVLLDDDTPLHAALRTLAAHPRVRVVPRLAAPQHEIAEDALARAATDIAGLFAAVDALLPRGMARPVAMQSHSAGVTLRLSTVPSAPVPVLLRQTYFPDWQGEGGEHVWLASPSFQLVFMDRAALTLRRRATRLHAAGWIGSALGLLLLAYSLRGRRRGTRA